VSKTLCPVKGLVIDFCFEEMNLNIVIQFSFANQRKISLKAIISTVGAIIFEDELLFTIGLVVIDVVVTLSFVLSFLFVIMV
jgi:hypothetical protein